MRWVNKSSWVVESDLDKSIEDEGAIPVEGADVPNADTDGVVDEAGGIEEEEGDA